MNTLARMQSFERYMLSGSLIFILGYGQYNLIYAGLKGCPMRAGIAWALHFVVGTVWSHAIHRGFTFRHYRQRPYSQSLFRTFGLYTLMMATSSLLMLLICDVAGLSTYIGWGMITLVVALGNFLIMSHWTICLAPGDLNDAAEHAHTDCTNQE